MQMPAGAPLSSNIVLTPQQFQAIQRNLQALQDQLTVTRGRLCALEAAELLRKQGKEPRYPIEFRSQFGEDALAWELLARPLEGFFIEVGAFDGYHYSVTYALEAMGWNGLLIEAIPDRCAACRDRRKHSRVVHAALSKPGAPESMEFTVVKDQYGGMLSYLEHGGPEVSGTGPAPAGHEHAAKIRQQGFATSKVTVPVTTMDALLEGHGSAPTTIDLAVIDVEGAEEDVLEGFDLRRWRPRVLVLEDNLQRQDSALGNYMEKRGGYVQAAWIGVNRVYVREEERGLMENLRRF